MLRLHGWPNSTLPPLAIPMKAAGVLTTSPTALSPSRLGEQSSHPFFLPPFLCQTVDKTVQISYSSVQNQVFNLEVCLDTFNKTSDFNPFTT